MTSRVDQVLERAIALAAQPDENLLALCRCLAELRDYEPGLLGRFIRASGMGRRKAYHLANIGERLQGLRLPEEQLRNIGWTKLQLISKKLNAANARRLLKQAEDHSVHELAALMRGEALDKKSRVLLLYFSPEEYRTIERDLLNHGARRSRRGLANKEEAVRRIFAKARQAGRQSGRK
jgi:hypothetical protein